MKLPRTPAGQRLVVHQHESAAWKLDLLATLVAVFPLVWSAAIACCCTSFSQFVRHANALPIGMKILGVARNQYCIVNLGSCLNDRVRQRM